MSSRTSFARLRNHEAWIGEQYQELEEKLLDMGVTIFHENTEQLVKNKEIIQLAGLDDPDFTDRDSSIQESITQSRFFSKI